MLDMIPVRLSMTDIAWQTEHSVETSASLDFAWTFMSNVANWDDPPAQPVLDGPFASGSRGTTQMPGQPLRHWQLRTVVPMKSYKIEFPLEGAVMNFEWRFAAMDNGRTLLTQCVALEGENAAAYLPAVQQTFGMSLKPGMEKISAAMDSAYISHL
jgi:hypothetical protein